MTEVTPNLPHFGSFCKYCFMGTLLLSPHYIRRLCKQGKIRYVNAGHMWLVNLDSLARYFEQGDPAPTDSRQTAHGIRQIG